MSYLQKVSLVNAKNGEHMSIFNPIILISYELLSSHTTKLNCVPNGNHYTYNFFFSIIKI